MVHHESPAETRTAACRKHSPWTAGRERKKTRAECRDALSDDIEEVEEEGEEVETDDHDMAEQEAHIVACLGKLRVGLHGSHSDADAECSSLARAGSAPDGQRRKIRSFRANLSAGYHSRLRTCLLNEKGSPLARSAKSCTTGASGDRDQENTAPLYYGGPQAKCWLGSSWGAQHEETAAARAQPRALGAAHAQQQYAHPGPKPHDNAGATSTAGVATGGCASPALKPRALGRRSPTAANGGGAWTRSGLADSAEALTNGQADARKPTALREPGQAPASAPDSAAAAPGTTAAPHGLLPHGTAPPEASPSTVTAAPAHGDKHAQPRPGMGVEVYGIAAFGVPSAVQSCFAGAAAVAVHQHAAFASAATRSGPPTAAWALPPPPPPPPAYNPLPPDRTRPALPETEFPLAAGALGHSRPLSAPDLCLPFAATSAAPFASLRAAAGLHALADPAAPPCRRLAGGPSPVQVLADSAEELELRRMTRVGPAASAPQLAAQELLPLRALPPLGPRASSNGPRPPPPAAVAAAAAAVGSLCSAPLAAGTIPTFDLTALAAGSAACALYNTPPPAFDIPAAPRPAPAAAQHAAGGAAAPAPPQRSTPHAPHSRPLMTVSLAAPIQGEHMHQASPQQQQRGPAGAAMYDLCDAHAAAAGLPSDARADDGTPMGAGEGEDDVWLRTSQQAPDPDDPSSAGKYSAALLRRLQQAEREELYGSGSGPHQPGAFFHLLASGGSGHCMYDTAPYRGGGALQLGSAASSAEPSPMPRVPSRLRRLRASPFAGSTGAPLSHTPSHLGARTRSVGHTPGAAGTGRRLRRRSHLVTDNHLWSADRDECDDCDAHDDDCAADGPDCSGGARVPTGAGAFRGACSFGAPPPGAAVGAAAPFSLGYGMSLSYTYGSQHGAAGGFHAHQQQLQMQQQHGFGALPAALCLGGGSLDSLAPVQPGGGARVAVPSDCGGGGGVRAVSGSGLQGGLHVRLPPSQRAGSHPGEEFLSGLMDYDDEGVEYITPPHTPLRGVGSQEPTTVPHGAQDQTTGALVWPQGPSIRAMPMAAPRDLLVAPVRRDFLGGGGAHPRVAFGGGQRADAAPSPALDAYAAPDDHVPWLAAAAAFETAHEFNKLIGKAASDNNRGVALRLWYLMCDRGVQPDIHTLNGLLRCLSRSAADPEEARKLTAHVCDVGGFALNTTSQHLLEEIAFRFEQLHGLVGLVAV